MKFYFSSNKETANFKKFKKMFSKQNKIYMDFAEFNLNNFTAAKFLPPELFEELGHKNYPLIVDFLKTQLPFYFNDKNKTKVYEILNDLYAIQCQIFVESSELGSIF